MRGKNLDPFPGGRSCEARSWVGRPSSRRRRSRPGRLARRRPTPRRSAAARRAKDAHARHEPRAPSDLDPHSAYDAGSGVALQGPFEGLIRLKRGTDRRVRAGPGRILGSQRRRERVDLPAPGRRHVSGRDAARRLRGPGVVRAPVRVGSRPVNSPRALHRGRGSDQRADRRTLVFDLGRPQPLF